MDAVFGVIALALWWALVLMVRGLALLDKAVPGEQP